jgi:hypothetical protein
LVEARHDPLDVLRDRRQLGIRRKKRITSRTGRDEKSLSLLETFIV